jgi:AraC-like DNA-binding protein
MLQPLLSPAQLNAQSASNCGVLSAAANGLDGFIVQHGGDLDQVFGRAGIDPEQLLHPTLSLPLPNYCKVLEEAARQTACDNFGLRYGQQFQPQALGLLGYIGLCSATLEEALINFAKAFPFHQHSTLIQLVDQGECYRFDYQVRHGAINERRQDAELTMGMATNLVRHVLGRDWAPREVTFEHAQPENWQEHREAFQTDIRFGQACNTLLIPKHDLAARTMPGSDPILLMLIKDAIRQLGESAHEVSLLDQARQAIAATLHLGEPVLEDIAQTLGLSGWTLQRRLREHRMSFTQLVDQIRQQSAMTHLKQQRLSVTQLATALGYSETSAFSRAFKRWFGISPKQWRSAADS